MSRSGYTDDEGDDVLALGRWRGAVKSAINGRRGQQALREILAALDAMPEKQLAAESLVTEDGEFCTLGVLGAARGIDMAPLDPEDWDAVAKTFGVSSALVREIVFENDESVSSERSIDVEIVGPRRPQDRDWWYHKIDYIPDPTAGKRRWQHMRAWVAKQIKGAAPAGEPQNKP